MEDCEQRHTSPACDLTVAKQCLLYQDDVPAANKSTHTHTHSFYTQNSFASTKNELHDFAPDKEPLLSMLEGEIQAMYRSKPGKPSNSATF